MCMCVRLCLLLNSGTWERALLHSGLATLIHSDERSSATDVRPSTTAIQSNTTDVRSSTTDVRSSITEVQSSTQVLQKYDPVLQKYDPVLQFSSWMWRQPLNCKALCAGQALGYQSMLKDLGIDLPIRLWTDSSAAIGICSRQGLGKLRHLDTHTLWIQQAVRSNRVDLKKVRGDVNPADVFTKHSLTRDKLRQLVGLFSCEFKEGRLRCALKCCDMTAAENPNRILMGM